MRIRSHISMGIVLVALLLVPMISIAACGTQNPSATVSSETSTSVPSESTTESSVTSGPSAEETTTIPDAVNAPKPGTYLRDEIPTPIVEGSYRYLGDGWFTGDTGDFFWRDGRFVTAEGALMGIPESLKEYMHSHGVDAQPTATVTHYDKPKLETNPADGVTVTVEASQWTEDRVTASVTIRNTSGSSFSFANRDLKLILNNGELAQTNPDMAAVEVASGAAELHLEVYFIVSDFNPGQSEFVYGQAQ